MTIPHVHKYKDANYTLKELSDLSGIKVDTLRNRIEKIGLSAEEAISKPLNGSAEARIAAMRKCKNCAKLYSSSGAMFCSRECLFEWKREHGKLKSIKCPMCGDVFRPHNTTPNVNVCSIKCRGLLRRTGTDRPCKCCKKMLHVAEWEHFRQYCSQRCKTNDRAKKAGAILKNGVWSCSVDGCKKAHRRRGYCDTHSQTADLAEKNRRESRRQCSVSSLDDNYIRSLVRQKHGHDEFPEAVIDARRTEITIKRALKKHGIHVRS